METDYFLKAQWGGRSIIKWNFQFVNNIARGKNDKYEEKQKITEENVIPLHKRTNKFMKF